MSKSNLNIAFFGTDEVSIAILEELKNKNFIPKVIITQPDKPQGRKLVLTSPPVKIWAEENNIKILQPEKLDKEFREILLKEDWDLFIVASYGKIIPEKVIEIPKYKTINVHPSLLPLYRGPTPVEQAILDDAKETGVTIMRMDKELDHGPIIEQEMVYFENWPDKPEVLDQLAHLGGKILAEIIPDWIAGNIDEQEQDHDLATFTNLIEKKDGEINLEDDPYKNFLKYKAYKPWPGTFFFKDGKRIKITEADFTPSSRPELGSGSFIIKKVIPEGKKEIDYKN